MNSRPAKPFPGDRSRGKPAGLLAFFGRSWDGYRLHLSPLLVECSERCCAVFIEGVKHAPADAGTLQDAGMPELCDLLGRSSIGKAESFSNLSGCLWLLQSGHHSGARDPNQSLKSFRGWVIRVTPQVSDPT